MKSTVIRLILLSVIIMYWLSPMFSMRNLIGISIVLATFLEILLSIFGELVKLNKNLKRGKHWDLRCEDCCDCGDNCENEVECGCNCNSRQ